jgi:hypothetical protein
MNLSKILLITLIASSSFASNKNLEKKLTGTWVLKSQTCNSIPQALGSMNYTLSFNGTKGEYVSTNKECKQIEPEIYSYPTSTQVSIKQGVRSCLPSPCAADLEATQCGKETNPATPLFDVKFKDPKTMVLSTSDPKSIDCIGQGQQKPAVFEFSRK